MATDPQMDRIEHLLSEIRDLLKAQQPAPPFSGREPLVPYGTPTGPFDGPTMGTPYTETAPPYQTDPPAQAWMNNPMLTVSGPLPNPFAAGLPLPESEPSPLMAMLSAPLPGKAGPDSLYPDPTITPGWLNPDVTQGTIMQTIGVVGWTATIRPSAAEMGAMKAAYCKAHGIPDPTKGEWDHFISLELGGAPRDPRNLWWQQYADGVTCMIGAREKDRVETALKRQIVAGQITLAEGQRLITTDWYAVYLKLNKLGMLPMLMTFDPSGDADEDDNA
jgi:hypothetical protein